MVDHKHQTREKTKRRTRLEADKLLVRVDSLVRREELTVDQQHQLLTVKRYLMLDPDPQTKETQAALACAEIVVDNTQLHVYQRRYGLTPQ
jgi:hypothetical protein